jgi:methionyl-tRNA formyltransferase
MNKESKKILFLCHKTSLLTDWLMHRGENILIYSDKLTLDFVTRNKISFIISYGYRFIITEDILQFLNGQAINLHISYLPWCRGADPNLWSFIENSPKGVSIHYIDKHIDTGDLIVQRQVFFDIDSETLATTYQKLQIEIQQLFKENWNEIKNGKCSRTPQNLCEGSFHTTKDRIKVQHLLTLGWDTPVANLVKQANL